MLIKYLDGTEAHIHPQMGNALVAAKLATQIPIPKKVTIPDPHWLAIRGLINSGIEDTPSLYFHCKGCGHKEYAHGPTAHLTTKVRHCGQMDLVPEHVGKLYMEYRRIHDKALVENKRRAAQSAKFKAAEAAAMAAAGR